MFAEETAEAFAALRSLITTTRPDNAMLFAGAAAGITILETVVLDLHRMADALEALTPAGRLAGAFVEHLTDIGLGELVEQVAIEQGLVKGADGKWFKP